MKRRPRRPRPLPVRRTLACQPLEDRYLLAASVGWDGPGLGSAELTYHVANAPQSLSQAETDAAIETALAAWSAVADITFTPTTQDRLPNSIDIEFSNIDGPGGTLAQAYFPDDVNPQRIAGDVQFDSSEVWEVGNSQGEQAFDLVWVAVHEIGHALGLDHLSSAASVLAPTVSPNQAFAELEAGDVEAIQRLYAPAEVSLTPPATPGNTANLPSSEDPPTDEDSSDVPPTDHGESEIDPVPGNRWRWTSFWRGFRSPGSFRVPHPHNFFPTSNEQGDRSPTALDSFHFVIIFGQTGNPVYFFSHG